MQIDFFYKSNTYKRHVRNLEAIKMANVTPPRVIPRGIFFRGKNFYSFDEICVYNKKKRFITAVRGCGGEMQTAYIRKRVAGVECHRTSKKYNMTT